MEGEIHGLFVLVAVRFVQRDERKYYEALLQYSREHFVVRCLYMTLYVATCVLQY